MATSRFSSWSLICLLKAQADIASGLSTWRLCIPSGGEDPALMKGFFDRIFLPGFAFKYREGKALPDKLLKGRTAHLLVTMDTRRGTTESVLSHAGAAPDAQDHVGVLRHQTVEDPHVRADPRFQADSQRQAWLKPAQEIAAR